MSGATRYLRGFPVSLRFICSFQLQSLAIPHRNAKRLHKLCFMERNTSFCLLVRSAKATLPKSIQFDILTCRKHLVFISASFQGQQHQKKTKNQKTKQPRITLLNNSYPKFTNTGGKTALLPCPKICVKRPRTSLFQCLNISTVPL